MLAVVYICYDTVAKSQLMAQLSPGIFIAAIEGFEGQKRRIDEQIAELRALSNGQTPLAETPKKRGMSAAGRRAIAEAQRNRWAAAKTEAPKTVKRAKKKRVLSAAGKAATVAALKRRWAAKKAAAKK